MYLVTVTSPGGDDFVSLGKTKQEAIDNMIAAYKDRFDMTDDDVKNLGFGCEYSSFEQYLTDYLGMGEYKISSGEVVVLGYDIHYKKGERI